MITLGDGMKLFHRMAVMPPSSDEIAQATIKLWRWIRMAAPDGMCRWLPMR
jgi:hypothetical protein